MKRKIVLTVILILIIFIGYFTIYLQCSEYKQHSEWLINETENSFKYELFVMTNELSQIYTSLMDAYTNEKCSYAMGKIDSFLSNDPYHEIQRILNCDEMSQELSDDILNPSLSIPLKNLLLNSKKHLNTIREEALEPRDYDKIRAMNVKFYEISNLLKELDFGNYDSLTDKITVDECIEILGKLNSLLAQN